MRRFDVTDQDCLVLLCDPGLRLVPVLAEHAAHRQRPPDGPGRRRPGEYPGKRAQLSDLYELWCNLIVLNSSTKLKKRA